MRRSNRSTGAFIPRRKRAGRRPRGMFAAHVPIKMVVFGSEDCRLDVTGRPQSRRLNRDASGIRSSYGAFRDAASPFTLTEGQTLTLEHECVALKRAVLVEAAIDRRSVRESPPIRRSELRRRSHESEIPPLPPSGLACAAQ